MVHMKADNVSQPDEIICPNCQHHNAADADVCAQCGKSLSGRTTVAAPAIAAIDVLQPLIQPPALNIGEVMFLVAGKPDPIRMRLMPGENEIMLGRRFEGENGPHLDLSEVSEAAASVSRRHALVRLSGDKPTVQDLGSTNGTWVNENELAAGEAHPLSTGDLIRMGQQFVFIYFAERTGVLESITLTDKRTGINRSERLTLSGLTRDLGGYLHALQDIQQIVDEILSQPSGEISIRDINVRESPAVTQLHVKGALAAIRLVVDRVVPWRKLQMAQLDRLWQASPEQADAVRNEFDLKPVLTQMIQQVAGHLAEAEQDQIARKLLPPVSIIALSPFELSATRLRG
jgi:pSer/pThr/pTyr-binding forkhead associated (FHA) protein